MAGHHVCPRASLRSEALACCVGVIILVQLINLSWKVHQEVPGWLEWAEGRQPFKWERRQG